MYYSGTVGCLIQLFFSCGLYAEIWIQHLLGPFFVSNTDAQRILRQFARIRRLVRFANGLLCAGFVVATLIRGPGSLLVGVAFFAIGLVTRLFATALFHTAIQDAQPFVSEPPGFLLL